jgi:hypothetical protein
MGDNDKQKQRDEADQHAAPATKAETEARHKALEQMVEDRKRLRQQNEQPDQPK